MIENPWVSLPSEPDYVLPDDAPVVKAFNERRDPASIYYLHVRDILPEPFVGAKDAPVVLLSNNPGFGEMKTLAAKKDAVFMAKIRNNLLHKQSEFPFVFLDPDYRGSNWWDQKLRQIIEHFGISGRQVVANAVLNIVYFPYPSCRFGHANLRLRSQAQEYNFWLVQEAMRRNAVIIHMRKPDKWLENIPGLRRYTRQFEVLNTQTPIVTEHCPGYREAIGAIEGFVKQQPRRGDRQ